MAGLALSGDYSAVRQKTGQKDFEVNWNIVFNGASSWDKDDDIKLAWAMAVPALNGQALYETCRVKMTNEGSVMSNATWDQFGSIKCAYLKNLDAFTKKKDIDVGSGDIDSKFNGQLPSAWKVDKTVSKAKTSSVRVKMGRNFNSSVSAYSRLTLKNGASIDMSYMLYNKEDDKDDTGFAAVMNQKWIVMENSATLFGAVVGLTALFATAM